MKKMTSKLISTLVILVLVATALLGSGDILLKDQLISTAQASSASVSFSSSPCTLGASRSGSYFFQAFTDGTYTVTFSISGGTFPSPPSGSGWTMTSTSASKVVSPGTSGSGSLFTTCGPPAGTTTVNLTVSGPTPASSSDFWTTVGFLPPTVSITPPEGITIIHSDAGGIASTHTLNIDIDDRASVDDPQGDSSIGLVGCSPNWSITVPTSGISPTSGEDGWYSTLTYTYPKTGPIINDPCQVSATDAEGTTLSNIVTFNATNAPPVVTTSFGLCPDPGGKTLAALTVADPGCTSDGTVTITDSDDVGPFDVATATALPAGVSLVPSLPASFPAGPNGMQVVVADDFTGGTVIFRAEDMHDLAGYSPGVNIGPTRRRDPTEPPEVVYVDREPPPTGTPPEDDQCRRELYNDIDRLFLEVSLESSAGTNDTPSSLPTGGVFRDGFGVVLTSSIPSASTTDETEVQVCGPTDEQIQEEMENIIMDLSGGFLNTSDYSQTELDLMRRTAIATLIFLGPNACDPTDAVTDNFNRG